MSSTKWNYRRTPRSVLVASGLAGLGLSIFAFQGFGQVEPDRDPAPPARPPVELPADPIDRPDQLRGMPPEAADTPVTRPATLMTYTGKAGLVEADDDKVVLLLDDGNEEKTFTVDPEAKIVLNGKPGRLKDLISGDILKVTSHKAEPSVAQSIVAARTTETTSREPSSRRPIGGDRTQSGGGDQNMEEGGDASASAVAGGGGGAAGMVMPFQGRVFTMQVIDGSSASELGLQPGDTILLVGANNMLPNNAILDGGGAGLNQSQMGSGLILLPNGTLGFGGRNNLGGGNNQGAFQNGTNTGLGFPGVGNGLGFPGTGLIPGNGLNNGQNNDGTNNQNDGARNRNPRDNNQGASGNQQGRQPQQGAGQNRQGAGAQSGGQQNRQGAGQQQQGTGRTGAGTGGTGRTGGGAAGGTGGAGRTGGGTGGAAGGTGGTSGGAGGQQGGAGAAGGASGGVNR